MQVHGTARKYITYLYGLLAVSWRYSGHGNTDLRTSVLSTGLSVRTAQRSRRHPVEPRDTSTRTGTGNRRYPVSREIHSLGLVQETGDTRWVEEHLDQDWYWEPETPGGSRNTSTGTGVRKPETSGGSRETPRSGLETPKPETPDAEKHLASACILDRGFPYLASRSGRDTTARGKRIVGRASERDSMRKAV